MRGLWRIGTRTTTLTPLVIVSHHFMSAEELGTPLGQERAAHCVFHVAVNGELRSMCEVNAAGICEAHYTSLATAAHADAAE